MTTYAPTATANWSNIGSGIFMASVNGVDMYATKSQGSWAIMVARAGERITARYATKREAMVAAEAAAS